MQQTAIFDTKQTKRNKTLKTAQNDKNRTNRQKLVTLPVMDRNDTYIWGKFGLWLMDVAKYMTTALLLSTVFADLREGAPTITYIVTGLLIIVVLVLGMVLLKVEHRKEKTNE